MKLLLLLTLFCSLMSSNLFAFYSDDDGYSSVLGFYYDSNGNPGVSSCDNQQISDASSSHHESGIFFSTPIAGWDKKEVVNQLTNLVADEDATPGPFAKMAIETFRSQNGVSEEDMNNVEIATIILDELQN